MRLPSCRSGSIIVFDGLYHYLFSSRTRTARESFKSHLERHIVQDPQSAIREDPEPNVYCLMTNGHTIHYSNALANMARQQAHVVLHPLGNANGSASFTGPDGATTITAGVNYPVEVPFRSDELPEGTVVEINLRPANGVALIRERHVESLLKRTLQAITRLDQTPRMMLQVTLQITSTEIDETLPGGMKEGGQGETYLPVLAPAINAAVLGCLDAGVEMKQVAGAALIGFGKDGACLVSPDIEKRKNCRSLHVFAFDGTGDVLLAESEGKCTVEQWARGLEQARLLVCGQGGDDTGLLDLLRRKIGEGVER